MPLFRRRTAIAIVCLGFGIAGCGNTLAQGNSQSVPSGSGGVDHGSSAGGTATASEGSGGTPPATYPSTHSTTLPHSKTAPGGAALGANSGGSGSSPNTANGQ